MKLVRMCRICAPGTDEDFHTDRVIYCLFLAASFQSRRLAASVAEWLVCSVLILC